MASDRIVIVGGPRTGKSTIAHRLAPARHVRSTDELVGVLEWSEVSEEVARWLDEPGPWVIEGVATARALRKWLNGNPGKALDVTVILLRQQHGDVSKGQVSMAKGVATVWNEIVADLLQRGVKVTNGAPQEPVRGVSEGPPPPAA